MPDRDTAAVGDDRHQLNTPEEGGERALAARTAVGQLPFVNRENELMTLEGSLGRAVVGRGQVVLIAGEPGIGKTRLVGELVSVAEAPKRFARPPRVVIGRCWDRGGAPTLWPWSVALRQLVAGADAERLREELGTGAGWIAALVPELHALLPELEQAPPSDTEQSRFVLFDAITSFLRRSAERQPLVVVLDDLHAADRFSLLALLFLARQVETMSLLLVGTHRESEVARSERLRSLFARLEREALRIPLQGLGAPEIAELIGHRRAGSIPELTTTLHQATGGNPFFLDEAMRMLDARGGLEHPDPAQLVPLSSGVQAVIEQRLDALGPEGLDALRYAATVGSVFSLAVVIQASGRTRAEIVAELEPAIAEALVRPRTGEVGVFEFGHDLIRETVLAGMTAAARAAAHQAVGRALERRYAGSLESHVEELAHHFLEALATGDAQPALRYAEQAADHAMSLFAQERAARLYAAALETLDLADELDAGERVRVRARLLLGLGRAFQRLADPRARATLREAAATARTAQQPELLAGVALSFGAFALSPGTVEPEVVGLLREALATDPPPERRLRAQLLGRLARALYWDPDPAPRMALAQEAIAQARGLGDPEALAIALCDGVVATRSIETTGQALQWIDELLSIPQAPWEMIVAARSIEIDLLLERGQVRAADASIESLDRFAERLRDVRAAAYAPLHRARRALMEGRFAEAEELLALPTETAERIEDSTFPLTVAGLHLSLGLLCGQPERVRQHATPLARALPQMRVWSACLIAAHEAEGQHEDAGRELERALADGVLAIPRDAMWLITIALLAEGVAAVGTPEQAHATLELLAPFAGRDAISPVGGYRGPVDRYLGLLAESLGDFPQAEAHLRAALAIAERERAEPMRALAALDLARVLIGQGGDPKDGEAREWLELGRRLGAELGMAQIAGAAEALRGRTPTVAPESEVVAIIDGTLVREGEVWAFTLGDRLARVRDSKGVRQLARLVAEPGREIHALELARDVGSGGERGGEAGAGEALAAGELVIADPGSGSGPLLDDAAKAAYRRRLQDLEEELEEAERWRDPERAARAREELGFITTELSAAVGLGGRDRTAGSDAERARVNVTRAVRTAIRRVAEADEQLGAELEATVRTGLFCVLRPDPRRPVRWEVRGLPGTGDAGRGG